MRKLRARIFDKSPTSHMQPAEQSQAILLGVK
jgi:hypothetical protein